MRVPVQFHDQTAQIDVPDDVLIGSWSPPAALTADEAVRATTPAPRVVVISYPHNPTTATATPELLQRLVDLARERDLILVHDFAYADIAFDGHVPPSVLAWPQTARAGP